MLTIFIFLMVFMIVAVMVAIIAGIVAISPLILLLFALPLLDVVILRLIFKRKKK